METTDSIPNNSSTSLEELKRLELRFLMADDDRISSVLDIIFVDILRKFFEQDVLEARSLDSTEKIKTLTGICNCIRDRITTSGNKITIPIKAILEFMIIEEFNANVHLNKIIQLYLQETIYDLLKNSLFQRSLNKIECAGLLFQACLLENLTASFQHRLFLLFIYCIPKMLNDFKNNLLMVGFPQIMIEGDRIEKLKTFSIYFLDYYNFLNKDSGLKAKIVKFKEEVLLKDTDPNIMKYGTNKMNMSDTLQFLQINLISFLSTVFSINPETDVNMESEESKSNAESKVSDEDKSYPSYSYKIIPVFILSTASLINEVNEKAKNILKSYEKYSDMGVSTINSSLATSQQNEGIQIQPNSANAVSVWAETMKFYLNMVRNSMQANLNKFDDQNRKSVILFARNLKRNVLEYALKWDVTARLPQLMTAINDQGPIRFLGLRFIDHMIKHMFVSISEEVSKTNARAVYTLLSKIIAKEGFLDSKERSLAYQSMVEVIIKMPELLDINKKDSIELMDEAFNEFKLCSELRIAKDNEVFANWVKSLGRMKYLFQNSTKKGFVIVKMTERIEEIINKYGIDDDSKSINIFIWLDWIEFLCKDSQLSVNLMYIAVILSHANDLKIKDKANFILVPLLEKLGEKKLIYQARLYKNETEESKEETVGFDVDDNFMTSMFIKKASQYKITSMKGFQIAEQLCSISLTIYQLIKNDDERSSLQGCLETRILELFSKSYEPYSQKLFQTLELLKQFIEYTYTVLHQEVKNDILEYKFLFRILQTTSNINERRSVFLILKTLLTKGNFFEIYNECLTILEGYKYYRSIDYGVEEHSCIFNLVILIIISNCVKKAPSTQSTSLTYDDILSTYYKLCSDFNSITSYKQSNLDKIDNFGFSIGQLGSIINLRELSEDTKWSNAFDDLLAKMIEIVDNKDLDINFRKKVIEEYLCSIYTHTEEYLDHVQYLREQYLEYDQYELHQSIGKSASKLLRNKDVEDYFSQLMSCINSKESTLIAKRASIVHLSEFVLNSELIKDFQELLTKLQGVFFRYIFDKKEIIQESASNVMTKLYQLGDATTREKLVRDLTRALGGSQTLTHMQEKEEDFELNIEYKPSVADDKKLKTFKELCDIATDIGHKELIYQFLNIHRHLNHYQNIKTAATSLQSIILEDRKVREDLMKMVPKIFLMTYDYNEDFRDTMKEVMHVLLTGKEEKAVLKDKWDEIIQELLDAINNKKEFRKRLAGLHALSDIIYKEDWARVKPIFEKLFNVAFKLIDDFNDNVKNAAYTLLKTLRKITLRNGNIYTCTNISELKEIFAIVLPLLLEKGIISHLNVIKFYSVSLLYDILETSREESVVEKLKVKNSREDRQLNYTYNSKQKMREIMSPYLKDIIILIIECISDFESELWNKVEQEVASRNEGKSSNLDHALNDMRIKNSKDSVLYDILSNCKDLLTEDVLDAIIPDLIKIIEKGVGLSTRAGAWNFIIEASIERQELFKLKFAKKVFKSCTEILTNAKNCKDSLLKIICRLACCQFRVFSKSDTAVYDAVDQINQKFCASISKYEELNGDGFDKYWIAYLLVIREAFKNIKESNGSWIWTIKNNALRDETKDDQVRKLASSIFKDIFENRTSPSVEYFEDVIFKSIISLLDSSNFMIRTNGAAALADLCQYLEDTTFLQKLKDKGIIDLLINKNLGSKYFIEYIRHVNTVLDFGVGGIKGKYVRSNAILLGSISEKLTRKMANQITKSDTDIEYKKQAILLLTTIASIQMHLIRLDYDTPEDAKKVTDSREQLFEALYSVLIQNYSSASMDMQVDEEIKDPGFVVQPDSKNKDIRSVNKEVFEYHQLVIEALSYSDTSEYIKKQYILYKSMYFSVSWEIRLGILKNLDSLLHTVNKSKEAVKTLITSNPQLDTFLTYLTKFTKEKGEKYDIILLHLSKILKTLVQSLDSSFSLRSTIYSWVEDIFATKVMEDELKKRKEKEMAFEDHEGDGGINMIHDTRHQMFKQENQVLVEIMQNYYIIMNSK